MSWEEYKKKRNKQEDKTTISNSNSETSSWEQYKQKREQTKAESRIKNKMDKVFINSSNNKQQQENTSNQKLLLPLLNKGQAININNNTMNNLANMSSGQRVAMINAMTNNQKDFNKLNQDVIQYQQEKEVEEKANKINQDVSNGNYGSAIGHVLSGVPQKALDSTSTTFASLNSLVAPKKINATMADENELLKTNRALTSKYENTTSQIDSDIVKTASGISGTIGSMAPSILANFALPGSGVVVQGVNVGADAYQDTLNEDASNKLQATITGVTKGVASALIEKISGGNILGKGSLDDTATNFIASHFKGKVGQKLASKAYEMLGEIGEENLENQVGYIIDKVVNGKDITAKEWWNELGETSKNTFLTTLVLNLLGLGGNTYNEVQDVNSQKYLNEAKEIIRTELNNANALQIDSKTNALNELNNVNTIEDYNSYIKNNESALDVAKQQYNLQQNQTNNDNNLQTQQTIQEQNQVARNSISEQTEGMLNNKELPMQSYQYEITGNAKIDNFNKNASMYFNNSEKSRNFLKMLQKIITDKNIDIVFDGNLKTADGRIANGSYYNGVITINPNSTRAGEFIAIHELTHAIGTKEMLNMVNTYRNSNPEFDTAVKGLLKNYQGTEITEEALADVAGQLFGNQEFINNIAQNNPNIFQKLYSEIKYLWHQFRGYKNQNQFVEDLYYKWTQAYKNNNSNIVKNNEILYNANERESDIYDTTRSNTKYENPRMETEDEKVNTRSEYEIRRIEEEKYYESNRKEVEQLIKDEIKIKFNFEDDVINEIYNNVDKDEITEQDIYDAFDKHREITMSEPSQQIINNIQSINKILRNTRLDISYIKGDIADWNDLRKSQLGKFRLANDGRGVDTLYKELLELFPGYFDANITNPTEQLLTLIEWRNITEEELLKPETYRLTDEDLIEIKDFILNSKEYLKSIKNIDFTRDNKLNTNTTKYSIQESENNSGSFSMQDNQGRTLTKEQQEYFKNSKVRDKNGNLLTVYHGSHSEFTIFDAKKSGQASKESKVGFWFTTTKEGAENFANSLWYGDNEARSYETYLNIRNPKVYDTIDNSIELKRIDDRMKELKGIIRKLENKNIAIEINKGELKWANENELADIAKYEGIDFEDAKQYHDVVNEYNQLEKDYDNKRYNDSYEKFRSDIYAVAGKSASDANFGGTGMWLQNEDEIISKFKQQLIDEGYDGIIIKGTKYDGETMGGKNNQYVAFYPEQIKNVNNTNPTNNPDIRYSQNNKTWQQYLDENFKPTGTRTSMQDILPTAKKNKKNVAPTVENNVLPKAKKKLNPTEIANLTIEDANTTPELKPKNYTKGNKQSSFFRNVIEDAQFLNKDLRQEMSQDENIRYYKGITNAETLEKAYTDLQNGGQQETMRWFNKENKDISAEDIAKGWILLKQYQDKGDHQSAVEVAKKMRNMGTKAGQAVQAYNILSRLTPEGMFYYAQSELSEAYNKMAEGKSKEWIDDNRGKFDLTPEETQIIKEKMESIQGVEDERTKKIALAEIQKIITDKIPTTASQSVKSWMRISMLFNPKTQVRNVAGNAVILPVNMTSDFIASGIDRVISKKTGVRTTGNINLKNYAKGFGKGLYESYDDFRKGINTRNIEGNRFEVTEGRNFKDKGMGKALNRVDNMLSFMLDAGDRGFYEATFTNSINNQLVLNNTTEVTADMIDIATQEALQRTWQDNNAYTQIVLNIRNALNGKVGKHKGLGYGLGDILIPFAKTPANLTKAIVDYSPVGLTKTIAVDARKLKNSLKNGQYTPQLQHKFVQDLGKGMAGSFLYVLGYALAKAGVITGEADDDKDVKNFMKNSLGINSYSIKIGDKSFAYDWAQPVATPFAIMANLEKYNKENLDASAIDKAINSINIGSEQLLQQSFMESINTVLNGNGTFVENLSQAVLELPSRAVPTLSKQVADMVDGTQRTSFEYKKPVESAINSVKAKIPFVSRTLPVSIDTLGNEIQKYGGDNNLWNVMFNPANMNKGELSKAGEEIYNVYMETGDATILPRTAPYYIDSKGERKTMTSTQRSEFQKITGKYVENAINGLLNNKDYKKLSDDKKAELINEIVSDSYSKAKYDILNIDSEQYEKLRKTLKSVSATSYYDYKSKTEGTKKDSEKLEVLVDANYAKKEKQTLYENYIKSKTDEKYDILKTINNFNIESYLEYKLASSNEEFKADRKDDGTLSGKTISGSAKNKKFNYISNMENTPYMQKAILFGLESTPNNSDKAKIVNYITSLSGKTNKEKLEMLEQFSWITIYKDGSFRY